MRRLLLPVVLGFAVCLSGCDRGGDQGAAGKPTIAFVLKTLNNPFFVDMQNGAKEAAKRLNVNLIVQAPQRDTDSERQMQIVENLIQTRPDALCIVPSGSKELLPAIAKANRAGIPVLIIDQGIDQEAARESGIRTETYIGSPNYDGGRIAGEFLVKESDGTAKVAILEGVPGQEAGTQRFDGFTEVLKGHPGMEIVASQTANFSRDQGFNVFQNMLTAHPEIDALFATNDMMALGAIEAIRAAGKTGAITVVGFDAVDDARDAIREGTMMGTVAQYPAEMGRMAVESAVKIITGESVPEYVPVKIEMFTQDNL